MINRNLVKNIFFAILFYWSSKTLSIFLSMNTLNVPLELISCAAVFVLNLCALLQITKFVAENFVKKIGLYLFLNFLIALPFAPDIYFLFQQSDSTKWPLAFVALAILSTLVTSLTRLPAVLLLRSLNTHKKRNVIASLSAVLVLHVCEWLVFLILPFMAITNFALPLPLTAPQTQIKLGNASELVVAFNPQISNKVRDEIRDLGPSGLSNFARKLDSSFQVSPEYKSVTYILPETTLFASREMVAQLYSILAGSYLSRNVNFTLMIGVREQQLNKFYAATVVNGELNVWPVVTKSLLVPVIESSWGGFYLGKEEDATVVEEETQETQWSVYNGALVSSDVAICYEAFDAKKILNTKPLVVVTNHGSFKRGIVLSRVYDATLQTLQILTQRPFVLVGNLGSSGALSTGVGSFFQGDFEVQLLDFSEL